ncbi:MAG: YbaN family protein [Acholeplasmataceae bacterium]
MIKIFYIIIAFISLVLGIIGIILPVLPTTPFLLLTLYAFSKSSEKFHVWFTDTKLYHKYLKTFVEQKAMTRKQKWQLMIFVDIILLSSFLLVESISLKILIILVDVIKYIYFFTKVKTITTRS